MVPTAFRWACSVMESEKFCERNDGNKPPKSGRCRSCRAPLVIREGLWGTFWPQSEGEEYDPARVVRLFTRHISATTWGASHRQVTRWIERSELHRIPNLDSHSIPHSSRRRVNVA